MLDENLKQSIKFTALIGVIAGIAFLFINKIVSLCILFGLLAITIYSFILTFSVDNVVIGISSKISYGIAYILRISALGGGLLLSYKKGSLLGLLACFSIEMIFRINLYFKVGKNKISENPKSLNEDDEYD